MHVRVVFELHAHVQFRKLVPGDVQCRYQRAADALVHLWAPQTSSDTHTPKHIAAWLIEMEAYPAKRRDLHFEASGLRLQDF